MAATGTGFALAVALGGCGQSSNTGTRTTSPSAPPTQTTPTQTTPTQTTTGASGPSGLSVTPAVGSPHSVIHFAFTPPYATGPQGSTEVSDALGITGPQEAGCVGVHGETLPSLPAGRAESVAVGPAQLGGAWCPGAYTARVEVLARPKCGQGQMCPQFIRVMKVLGPVRFRIMG